MLRYVERNPFRAGLVRSVADWPWNSLRLHTEPDRPAWYGDGPVRRGRDWAAHVAKLQTDAELVALRRSVERGVPYGSERWQRKPLPCSAWRARCARAGGLGRLNNEA